MKRPYDDDGTELNWDNNISDEELYVPLAKRRDTHDGQSRAKCAFVVFCLVQCVECVVHHCLDQTPAFCCLCDCSVQTVTDLFFGFLDCIFRIDVRFYCTGCDVCVCRK